MKYISHAITKTKLRIPLTWIRHQNLELEDVFLASYPRSGNSWLRFLLYEILSGNESRFETIIFTIPPVGLQSKAPRLLKTGGRLIKTHESYRREYRKAIYIVRDARDVVLSEYALQIGSGIFRGDFDKFLDDFLKGKVNGFGSWRQHVNSWLDAIDQQFAKVLFIKYEDMRKDTSSTLQAIVSFLGETPDNAKIQIAVDNNSLKNMRHKEEEVKDSVFKDWNSAHKFIGQGETKSGKGKLNEAQLQLINESCAASLSRCGYIK